MIRLIFVQSLLFLIPFAAYAAYIYVNRRLQARTDAVGAIWNGAPLAWLVIAGLVLVVIGIASLATLGPTRSTGHYVPAHVENGVLVPDHFD